MAEPHTQSQERRVFLAKFRTGFLAWRTRDILTIIVVGIVFGLLLTVTTPVTLLLGPVGWLWSGLWTVGPLFMAYAFRRPGAAFLTGMLCELVQWPLTQGGEISGIVRGVLFGLAIELVVALLTRYRSFGLFRMLLVGVCNSILIFLCGAAMAPILWGFSLFSLELLALAIIIVVLIVSCTLGAGLAKVLADAVARTGVLSNTALSRAHEEEV